MDIYSKYVNEGLRSALTSQLIFNKCWGECAIWGLEADASIAHRAVADAR